MEKSKNTLSKQEESKNILFEKFLPLAEGAEEKKKKKDKKKDESGNFAFNKLTLTF